MASDGKVVFQIEGDARGVKTTIKDVTNDIEKESKKWDNAVEQSTGNIEGSFGSMLKGIVGAISAAGIAKLILDWGKAAVSAASDLAEVQNVVDVTFGESAKKIDAWAKSAGNSYGLTETQAKRYASTIGAMLKSQGTAQKDVLEMSESLAGLAADMASFYNLDFDTAFEKIRAGISGETMPLKQLGINMSVANLEAFALEKGIKKSYTAMSQGEQTMLRYQYLMKATADAQGDFARTSDSMANATRRVQASWETIKTKGGELLLKGIEPLTSGFANILDMLTEEPERTVLDEFDDINVEMSRSIANLESTYTSALNLVSIIDTINEKTATLGNGKTVSYKDLFGDLDKVKQEGGNIREYLKSLGADAESIAQDYDAWRDALSRITQAVPELTSVIDAQTGAINGGTEAIKANLEEWKLAERQKVILGAYYAKEQALRTKEGEIGSYWLDMETARIAYEQFDKELKRKYGEDYSKNDLSEDYGPAGKRDLYKLGTLWVRYNDATNTYNEQVQAYGTATEQLAYAKQALINEYGEEAVAAFEAQQAATGVLPFLSRFNQKVKEIGDGAESTSKKLTEAADKQIANLKKVSDALQSVKDYADRMRDATESALSNVVKGFDTIERPTTELEKKRDRLIEQQNELNRATADGEQQYQRLEEQINDINKSLDVYTTKGMKDALSSQLSFLNEYLANLEKAQQMGLSDSLLASLSDGSVQSAEYLSVLVADPEQAKEIDKLYQQVTSKKEELTDALTEQKLSADEAFGGLVETAQNTIDELDLGDEAKTAMKNIVDGLTTGIYDNIEEFDAALSTIIGDVTTMIGTFESMKIGFGNIGISSGSILDGTHETGLDYVPFDNYLASLHEGEGILTAEENRIWQRFKNGSQPQTMDYDALGATMRENVHAGGNVYLDGTTVGRVISDAQGNSYRQLERSGWQQ